MPVSMFHEDDDINSKSDDAMKSSVITFYNVTKEAVDEVDQMKAEYSTT